MKQYSNQFDRCDYYQPHAGSSLAPGLLKLVRKSFRGHVGGMPLWGVDGQAVRVRDIDFNTGGNPARYLYVPPPELWVEERLTPSDAAPVDIHEAVETICMVKFGMSYEDAHNVANLHEWPIRWAIFDGRLRIQTREEEVRFADHYVREFWRQLKGS